MPDTVDPFYTVTTIIHRFMDGQNKGSATGFFFDDLDGNIFLVTNKHVIYGDCYAENPPVEINKIKLILHTNPLDLRQNGEFLVPLFEDERKLWLEHRNPEIDVILIPVNIDRSQYQIHTFDHRWINSTDLEIKFETIFVMGYPYGWYDQLYNLPISRFGHLSSQFKIPFQGKPFMLGDVETHPGMSGGPVIMHLKNFVTHQNSTRVTNLGASRTLLVGINSAKILWPLNDEHGTIVSPTLIIIWFPELILEILEQNVHVDNSS